MDKKMAKAARILTLSIVGVLWSLANAAARPDGRLYADRSYLNTLVLGGWRMPARALEQVEMAFRPKSLRVVEQQAERVVFSDMMFVADSEKLSDVGVGRCYLIAQKLKHGISVKVIIQGHSDRRGSTALNQKLDLRRAEAVKSQLESFGIPEDRMSAVSLGEVPSLAGPKADWARAASECAEFEIEAEEGTSSNRSPEPIDGKTL